MRFRTDRGTVSKQMLYVEFDAAGRARHLNYAPYLDYRVALLPAELLAQRRADLVSAGAIDPDTAKEWILDVRRIPDELRVGHDSGR